MNIEDIKFRYIPLSEIKRYDTIDLRDKYPNRVTPTAPYETPFDNDGRPSILTFYNEQYVLDYMDNYFDKFFFKEFVAKCNGTCNADSKVIQHFKDTNELIRGLNKCKIPLRSIDYFHYKISNNNKLLFIDIYQLNTDQKLNYPASYNYSHNVSFILRMDNLQYTLQALQSYVYIKYNHSAYDQSIVDKSLEAIRDCIYVYSKDDEILKRTSLSGGDDLSVEELIDSFEYNPTIYNDILVFNKHKHNGAANLNHKTDSDMHIYTVFEALCIFIYSNILLYDKSTNNTIIEKVVSGKETSTEHTTISKCVSEIKKDKVVNVKIDDIGVTFRYEVPIHSDNDTEEGITEESNETTHRRKCAYRYQVHGHNRNQWFGSKKDNTRHQESIWIAPYWKNEDAKYGLIKVFN